MGPVQCMECMYSFAYSRVIWYCNCETHGTLKQLFGIEYEDPEFEEWYQDFLRFAEKMDRKKGGIKF